MIHHTRIDNYLFTASVLARLPFGYFIIRITGIVVYDCRHILHFVL